MFCRLLPLNFSPLVCVHVSTVTVLMSKTVRRSSVGNELGLLPFAKWKEVENATFVDVFGVVTLHPADLPHSSEEIMLVSEDN